ncbi:hypothetical protein HYH03_000770 [Edaphochlamys debaryana]|uniref:Sugar phosphate transporter domain-containing protein n=1 Tax=Edaphochlamys debaryana TaxID=47281 RepID=A0A835YHA9_9CHLO|nr:hypothetical protein HYH03_000770 [Edaphochlamys debaryana]|eukprot:KAG2500946.1 hypothetical protein HYH03_000770 [Edaphochlamys debaryana]
MWLGLLVAFVYGAVAVAANFVNKYAVLVFPLPNAILLVQTVTTVVVLQALGTLGLVRIPAVRNVRLQSLFPLAGCYCGHALLVLYSLAFLSVPMYNTLKRLTPVMVLGAKAVVERRLPDSSTTFSVLLIVGGCLVAGAGDLSFSGNGYFLALVCAVLQSVYILLAERATGGGGGAAAAAAARRRAAAALSSTLVAPPSSGGAGDGSHHHHLGLNIHHAHPTGDELTTGKGGGAGAAAAEHGHGHEIAHGHSTGVDRHVHLTAHAGGANVSARASPLSHMTNASSAPPGGGPGLDGPGLGPGPSGPDSGPSSGPLSATELLYSICVIGVPLLCVTTIASGEGAKAPIALAAVRERMSGLGFAGWLATTAVTEGILTGSVILCTQLNSALTTSVVGVLKGVVSSVLGFFLLGGVKFHAVNVAGIVMNCAGGAWYSAVQYMRSGKAG